MVTVEEATGIINSFLYPRTVEAIPLTESVGRVLAMPVYADRDLPPFNRAAMDGIAISHQAFSTKKKFIIEGVQAAGDAVTTVSDNGKCMEIMTGAVVPNGTDTVIRYEDVSVDGKTAEIVIDKVDKGQNIHFQGSDAKKGDLLLESGVTLSPAEVALLAAIGCEQVQVFAFPRTAIISSGDELVDISATPEPHQIRRSNTYALEAAMREMGWHGTKFHFPDERDVLKEKISQLLSTHDVLILSGGVSKGMFDFIPEALEAGGVKKKFHQVKQRPGKPFWFGVSDDHKVVFALPGNPVSTYMCFYRYVKPWMLKSFGITTESIEVVLGSDVHFPPPLTYFIQVKLKIEGGTAVAMPAPGGGSGDFANLKDVSGFLQLPPNKTAFKTGELYPYIPFRYL